MEKEEKEETEKKEEKETSKDEDAGETTDSDKNLSTEEESEQTTTKEPTITNQISNKITSIGENIDIPLVTKYVKIFASVLLITLPFVPLFFSLGGKKTKKHKRKIIIKK
jgi:hypothetical protein